MKTLLRISIPVMLLLVGSIVNANNVLGHTFSGDESASFLAGTEMTKIELKLAADQISANATSAKEHANHLTEHITANDTKEIKERNSRLAYELNNTLTDFVNTIESSSPSESEVKNKASNITDILSEVVSARIDKEQLDNVTVKALVVNDLVGEVWSTTVVHWVWRKKVMMKRKVIPLPQSMKKTRITKQLVLSMWLTIKVRKKPSLEQ